MFAATQSDRVRSPLLNGLLIVLLLISTVSLPYLFEAPLSISRSYVAGFSNRAAILIFLVGTGALALWNRGRLAEWSRKDSRLGLGPVAFVLAVTVVHCLRLTRMLSRNPGSEGAYFFNRMQLTLAGKIPYKDFEFVYGPVLLYPPIWIHRLFHVSLVRSYSIVWMGFWLLGVVLMWCVVRWVDLPITRRSLVFVVLGGAQLTFAFLGGLSYTPTRAYFAAGCILATHLVAKRTGNLWLTVSAALASVLLSIGISMDQAVGSTIGVSVVLFLLVLSSKSSRRWAPFAVFAAATILLFVWSDHAGLMLHLKAFGHGGYAYPLVPSLPILAVLFTYIVAGCTLTRALFARASTGEERSPQGIDAILRGSSVIPLAIAGYSMIPNAMGRSDLLHMMAAVPLFAIGVMAAFSMPRVSRWYLPASLIAFLLFPFLFHRFLRHLHVPPISPDPTLVSQGYFKVPGDNQTYESTVHLASGLLPCDRQYFSPSLMPDPMYPFRPECLDTGYYLGYTEVITPAAIEFKVDELRTRSSMPLLMEDIPLEAQLPIQSARMQALYGESETFWVPPVRHAPLTYARIIDYIRANYDMGPSPYAGLRIWYPKNAKLATVADDDIGR